MIRRAGFSLIEMLIVVVVIGLMTLIALPRLADAFAQNNLNSTRAKVISLYSVARATASGSSRTTVLHVAGNQAYVTASPRMVPVAGSDIDTITKPESIYTEYGVTANVLPAGRDSILIDQSGLGRNGSNTTIILSKSGRADTITISQYGQIQK
ncbi:MAG: Tfp pilus assembly protein FimT/FimU [Gemmatimonadales bacterium]